MSRFSARRDPFSRGEKLLFATVPGCAAALVLVALWMRRADDVPRVNFPPPAALPKPNGFDLYVAAARSVRAANPPIDAVNDGRALLLTNPKLAATNYSLARRRAWLGANAAGFALFQQGLRTPSRFPLRRDWSADWSVIAPLRQLGRAKVSEANTRIMERRWGDATTACLDTIQMGGDISRGGPFLARMVGIAVTALGRHPLSTPQNVPEQLSADQAKRAARRLEGILAARPSFKAALQNGKWDELHEFLKAVEQGNWRARAPKNALPPNWRQRMAVQFVTPRQVVSRIEESFDRAIEDIDKPYNAPRPLAPPVDAITKMYVPRPEIHGRFSEGRERVALHTLLLRFALRAYRLEQGRFPDSLPQLAPRYLQTIPTDYFASGAPFRYRNDGKNYVLWSIGPDQKDDGGVPLSDPNFTKFRQSPSDFPQLLPNSTGDYVAGKNR